MVSEWKRLVMTRDNTSPYPNRLSMLWSEGVTQRAWSGSVLIDFLPEERGLSKRKKIKKSCRECSEKSERDSHIFYGMICLAFILLTGHKSSSPYCWRAY